MVCIYTANIALTSRNCITPRSPRRSMHSRALYLLITTEMYSISDERYQLMLEADRNNCRICKKNRILANSARNIAVHSPAAELSVTTRTLQVVLLFCSIEASKPITQTSLQTRDHSWETMASAPSPDFVGANPMKSPSGKETYRCKED